MKHVSITNVSTSRTYSPELIWYSDDILQNTHSLKTARKWFQKLLNPIKIEPHANQNMKHCFHISLKCITPLKNWNFTQKGDKDFFHVNGILSLKIAKQFKRLIKTWSMCLFWGKCRFTPPTSGSRLRWENKIKIWLWGKIA